MPERRPYHGVGLALQTIEAFDAAPDVIALARGAERVGLDHVWAPDHLLFHRPILEAVTTLAAVAGATERVGLGFCVLNGVLRPPVWLAKQLATLAILAPGRLSVGLGVGGEFAPEFEAAGVPLRGRGRRFDAALDELAALLRGEGPGLRPLPPELPPLLIGGRGEAAQRRAARAGDAWLPMWMDPGGVGAAGATLAEMALEHGRPAPEIVYMAFVNVTGDRASGRAQSEQFARRQYGLAFERVERWALIGEPVQIAERLHAYRELGVSGFVLCPTAPEPSSQLEGLAAVRAALA
jgi:alkanesulfonate monooxygenase SsuD/methylene tetrahydromethanopterin reductase-like flavin-dependent oxidoreductase (luciferase family)